MYSLFDLKKNNIKKSLSILFGDYALKPKSNFLSVNQCILQFIPVVIALFIQPNNKIFILNICVL